MTGDFILEISGAGEAITLEPVGMIDLDGALTMLAALDSLRDARHAALLEIRLDRVTGLTAEARRALSGCGLPVDTFVGADALAGSGAQ
jgi:hypothetical protein